MDEPITDMFQHYKKLIRRATVTEIVKDMIDFLFPEEGKETVDLHTVLQFCDKWYVKVGLEPYDASAKEKYSEEVDE